MMKEFKKVPVYTKDTVSYIKGDKKKQEVIDDMTSHLADRMAKVTSDRALVNEFGIDIALEEHRGGHNRRTVEMLNGDGYLVHVFHSIMEAAKFFGTSSVIDTNARMTMIMNKVAELDERAEKVFDKLTNILTVQQAIEKSKEEKPAGEGGEPSKSKSKSEKPAVEVKKTRKSRKERDQEILEKAKGNKDIK